MSDHAFQAVVTYIHVFIVQHLDMIALASLVKNHLIRKLISFAAFSSSLKRQRRVSADLQKKTKMIK